MSSRTNHILLPQVHDLVLEREEIAPSLKNLAERRRHLSSLPAIYRQQHAEWKKVASASAPGAPLPLEPSEGVPYSAQSGAETGVRLAEEGLTDAVEGSRDELMGVVKDRQSELFDEIQTFIDRMNDIGEEIGQLVRTAAWIDKQSHAHSVDASRRHLMIDMSPKTLVKMVTAGETYIDHPTGRILGV